LKGKQNGFNFDIPIPVIIIALFFSFPIGIILAVLRYVSSASGEQKIRDVSKKAEEKVNEFLTKKDDRTEKKAEHISFSDESFVVKEKKSKDAKAGRGKPIKKKRSAGTILSTVFCILFFVVGLFGLLGSFSDGVDQIVGNLIQQVVPFMTVSGISYLFSVFFKDKDIRLNRIRALIGDRDSFNLSKIASVSKQSLKKVWKDVQYLIDKGEFGSEAYIDLGTNTFMRYADAEPDMSPGFDYRTLYDEKIFGKDQAKNDKSSDSVDSQKQEVKGEKTDKDNFRSIILEIRRLNDEIHDFAVSERIYRIEEYTQYIFDYVTDHPEAMPKIRTFMNYYLPTTLKLLESYSRIERMGAAGENMKSSKEKIESILDLLVEGYKQQMDHLFQNESIDISSDISVLETMMQKDGLSGYKGFTASNDVEFGGAAAQQKTEDKE